LITPATEESKLNVGNRLFVGNLSFSTSQASLEATFGAVGDVREVAIPVDRTTGQPRGFAFVDMSSADASRAMQALNGTDFGGRSLKINEAQDKPRSGGGRPRY